MTLDELTQAKVVAHPAFKDSLWRDEQEWILYHSKRYARLMIEMPNKQPEYSLWPDPNVHWEYLKHGLIATAVPIFLCQESMTPHIMAIGGEMLVCVNCLPNDTIRSKLEDLVANVFKGPAVVGQLLATTWVTPGGQYEDPNPVLPIHITHPRQQVKFYQIVLPAGGTFKTKEKHEMVPVPITDIRFRILPWLISRFEFFYMQ